MGIEKIKLPEERKEEKEKFLTRNEILDRLVDSLKTAIVTKGAEKIFESGVVRMKDIVTLPQKQAQKLKEKREPFIERGIKELKEMITKGDIAPDSFRGGTAELAEFVSEALELAVKKIEQEKNEK